jgi:photosystem II stability/assembly factor-like uncharacterized protein
VPVASPLYLFSVSCASASSCVAVSAFQTAILTTNDGGTTWVSQTVPSGVSYLTGISCGSPSDCVAVAGSPGPPVIISTHDGGVMWTSQPVPNGVGALISASCATAHRCESVGQNQQSGALVVGTRSV